MLLTGIYVQLAVLALTGLWFILCKRRRSGDLGFKALAIVSLLLGLWLGSIWVYPPYWGLGVIAVAFAGLALWKYRRPVIQTGRSSRALSNIPALLIMALGAYIGINGFLGHSQKPDGPVVDLVSPFGPGDKACVLSGGLNSLVNQHNFKTDKPEEIAETHGLDVMGFRGSGFRTAPGYSHHPRPAPLEAYMAWGMALHAPCDGTVIDAIGDTSDHPIGTKIRVQGNQVLLACGDVKIWMAHLRKGSLTVSTGDEVTAGQKIGAIGNSGHTEEPHLHIHAETLVDPQTPMAHGQPVHMRFNGRFMARGDCF